MIRVSRNVHGASPPFNKPTTVQCNRTYNTILDLFGKPGIVPNVPISNNAKKKNIKCIDFIKAHSNVDSSQNVQNKHDTETDVNDDHNHSDNESKNGNLFAGSKTMVSPHPSELPMPPENWLNSACISIGGHTKSKIDLGDDSVVLVVKDLPPNTKK